LINNALLMMALMMAMVLSGFFFGSAHVQAQWDADNLVHTEAIDRSRQAQAVETVRVVTEYVDRVAEVREVTRTIIKKVPVYVPHDAPCAVPVGFVSVHNAAASRVSIPEPTKTSDAAVSSIDLTTVAETIVENYGRCHNNTEQLKALQEWILKMQQAGNQPRDN
jgi:hypothetical protein